MSEAELGIKTTINGKQVTANLLTGKISDPVLQTGFERVAHNIQNSKLLFKAAQLLFAANLIVQLILYYTLEDSDSLVLIMACESSFVVNLLWPLCHFRKQTWTKFLFTAMFLGQCIISINFTFKEKNGFYNPETQHNNVYLLLMYYVVTVKCLSPMSFQQNWYIVTPSYFVAFIIHITTSDKV